MNTLTPEQIKQARQYRSMVMNHNGHVGYQIFTGKRLVKPIKITGISSPIEAKPIFVGFIDPDLMAIHPANDMDNPDGSKAPPKLQSIPLPQIKKKPTLKRIK